MKTKLHGKLLFIFLFICSLTFSQERNVWKQKVNATNIKDIEKFHLEEDKVSVFELNLASFREQLNNAPLRGGQYSNVLVKIPSYQGELETFRIYEAPVFSSSLSEKYPLIKSYVGFNVDKPGERLRMSISHKGVQTMISYLDQAPVFMHPINQNQNSNEYVVYNESSRGDYVDEFVCYTLDESIESDDRMDYSNVARDADDQTLRTYRLAISVNGEYTAYHGGTVPDALAAINATVTRVNEVYETDMAITFTLVDAEELIFTNPATDPYSSIGNWNLELQNELTSTIGNAAYDIGHMFGASGGGGSAGCIGCVCEDDSPSTLDQNKGAAKTSPADGIPEGDTFDIDYVAHEIGHQMGATHTFGVGNEGAGTNAEPGSGTTIMGYAGITGPDDVQLHSDAYFHYHSINQILNNVASFPNNCATTTPIANNPPAANAGSNYTIPKGTAYILKGSATDPDGGDMLTYCWEQTNSGVVTSSTFGPNITGGAIARSLPPSTSPDRYIPNLQRVLNGQLTETNPGVGSDWETVTNVARSMTWALTVRDRNASATGLNGQSSFDLTNISVNGTAGPFAVTSQSSEGIIWNNGNVETITWDVAGTTGNGVNTSNVNILLSTDGGMTFDTVLAANTPNDGSESITVPDTPAPYCRIMIEPVDNIYYAVNSESFSIDYEVTTVCNTYSSGANLGLAIPDGVGSNSPGDPALAEINVPDNGTLSEIQISVDIDHTYIGDLVLQLQDPQDEAFVNVWDRTCNDNTNSGIDVTLGDAFPSIVCASPTSGDYAPANPLNAFDGVEMNGDWQLFLVDFWNADSGTLNEWSLEICYETVSPLSVNEFAVGDFSIFPNPNNGSFTVKLNSLSAQDIKIDVFDIRGRSIYNNSYENNGDFNQVIDLNNVQSGMYLVNVNDGEKTATKKIVVD